VRRLAAGLLAITGLALGVSDALGATDYTVITEPACCGTPESMDLQGNAYITTGGIDLRFDFRYRPLGSTKWITVLRSLGTLCTNCVANAGYTYGQTITGLAPSTTYEYQFGVTETTGKGTTTYAGPDGTPNTTATFTTGALGP